MSRVLITGANGLIGTRLTEILLAEGFEVCCLKRKQSRIASETAKSFLWDIDKREVDEKAFDGVSAIIHLAGAGVGEKRWNAKRKKEIIDSRVESANLIFDFLARHKHEVKTFISASAVGYYGDCGNELVTEERNAGKDFLSQVCTKWEESARQFSKVGIREVRSRFGIVLSKNGGALAELIRTIPFGFATYFPKPNLYYPWIHVDDVCFILVHALKNESLNGAFNVTTPAPMLVKDLMREILFTAKSKAILFPVPPIGLKLMLGEMSELLLSSQRCSAEKIVSTGYKFIFEDIKEALANIFG